MFHAFLFVAGLVGLIVGADLLVRGASKLALSLGISPLVVGLTIVAFGTSAPEMAVSAGAAWQGNTEIAIGNVLGSNVFNVLFILGLSAMITPLLVHVQLIRQEVPIMIGSALLLVAFALDARIAPWEAGVMLALLVAYTVFLIVQSRRQTAAEAAEAAEFDAELTPPQPGQWDSHWAVQVGLIVVGLAALVLGSEALVTASVAFAKALGVSDVVIALTIVAAGTSMPEVATSIAAALKGERDIAVGNVVGSNTFNLLGALGLTGLVAAPVGLPIASSVMHFDLWVMLASMVACLPIFVAGREIARWQGAVFFGYYLAYVAYLILAAQRHAALATYGQVMLGVVVPLTVITLVVVVIRPRPHPPTANG
jgi:cation:H+ antiporter